jgi:hypothetical protein
MHNRSVNVIHDNEENSQSTDDEAQKYVSLINIKTNTTWIRHADREISFTSKSKSI